MSEYSSVDVIIFVVSIVIVTLLQINLTVAECLYEGQQYAEGSLVPTSEPCLRCACAQSTLLCNLRVCAELPDPPPPGCFILHRHKTCCAQLICTDLLSGGNRIESRLEPDLPEIPYNQTLLGNGCIHNGTVYGSGSAMTSSTLCEYCYCINGKQHCVKPKCLLPLDGCKASFSPHSCCPTHYKCIAGIGINRKVALSTTHSTLAVKGCRVSGRVYPEGGKILGIGHSPCDNCYCMRGLVKCVPLSCAPPLLGCSPVIPPGECCAASYNCSGVIEVQPQLNYGHYPVVSKEYAKLRKEVRKPHPTNTQYIVADSSSKNKSGFKHSIPYYFTTSTGTPLKSTQGTTRQLPITHEALSPKYSKISLTTTRVSNSNDPNPIRPIFKPSEPMSQTIPTQSSPIYTPSKNRNTLGTSTMRSLKFSNDIDADLGGNGGFNADLDGRNNRRIDDQLTTEMPETESTTLETTTDTTTSESESSITTTTEVYTTLETVELLANITTIPEEYTTVEELQTETENETESETTTEESLTTTTTDTIWELNVTNPTTITPFDLIETSTELIHSSKNNPTEIEALLNISKTINKKDEDYDYDYSEPSLPPSLPNLKIIPFVAADAVVEEKSNPTVYPIHSQDNLRRTDDPLYGYTLNLFSPPIETEGGFVPRDPPILNNFYENGYHTTNIVDITSRTVLPVIVDSAKTNKDNCVIDGRNVRHGELTSEIGACSVCLCLFGNIVCQPPKCPALPATCHREPTTTTATGICCGHVVCIDDTDSPTVVLDRIDSAPEVTPDPFRDVIRTEPAPDLQSLIGDIMPFLVRQTTTPQITTRISSENAALNSFMVTNSTTESEINETTTVPNINQWYLKTDAFNRNSIENQSSVGLLKLAGCNIYGRMYRVGRIISELSSPCLECMCTEIGVQCTPLKC